MSLIEVLVGVALLGVLALGVSKVMTDASRGGRSVAMRSELEALKHSLLKRLDCEKTIKPTSGMAVCPSPVALRDLRGNPLLAQGKMGEWTVRTSCAETGADAGLKFSATRPGKDPLTGKDWKDIPAAADLFDGIRLCAEYFASSCPASHPLLVGFESPKDARCCRSFVKQDVAPQGSFACSAHETLLQAGHACHQPPRPASNLSFVPPINTASTVGAGPSLTSSSPFRHGYTASCRGTGPGPVGVVLWGWCCQ